MSCLCTADFLYPSLVSSSHQSCQKSYPTFCLKIPAGMEYMGNCYGCWTENSTLNIPAWQIVTPPDRFCVSLECCEWIWISFEIVHWFGAVVQVWTQCCAGCQCFECGQHQAPNPFTWSVRYSPRPVARRSCTKRAVEIQNRSPSCISEMLWYPCM